MAEKNDISDCKICIVEIAATYSFGDAQGWQDLIEPYFIYLAITAKYLVQFCEAKASKPDDGTLALLPKPAAKRQKVAAAPVADRVCFKCGACEKDILFWEPQITNPNTCFSCY